MRFACLLFAALLALVGCQPHGAIAAINLGWMHKIADVEAVEDVLRKLDFRPVEQQYLSERHAAESVEPWRRKIDGRIYSMFSASSNDPLALRAFIAFHERTGRLDISLVAHEADCSTKLFARRDQATIDQLHVDLMKHLGTKAKFNYVRSQRC